MKWVLAAFVTILAGALAACANQAANDKASENLERAAEINLNLGVDYLRKGKLEEAKEKIEKSLGQNPRSAKAHAMAGFLYDRLNDQRQAERHFDRAVSLDPKDSEVKNNYAGYLCSHSRFERGEKLAMQAAEDRLYKTPEVALLNAGQCALGRGDKEKAAEHFRLALQLQPQFPEVLLQMSQLEYQRQNYLPARAFLERYLTGPGQKSSPGPLLLGVRIENGLNNPADAKRYASRLKNEYPNSPEAKELANVEKPR
jgi:type IV pilus assembly protein PilF